MVYGLIGYGFASSSAVGNNQRSASYSYGQGNTSNEYGLFIFCTISFALTEKVFIDNNNGEYCN